MDRKELLQKRKAKAATREVILSEIEPGEEPVTVLVRGLTRMEIKEASQTKDAKSEKDLEKIDRNLAEITMISMGLVDPVMSVDEVIAWLLDAPGGDSVRVMGAISEMSGLNEDAGKRNLQNVRSNRRRRK